MAAFVLGVAGTMLPVLPTVPFMLVAAWAAGRGSPRFERWLVEHPNFGPPIRRWRERGAVPRKAKWAATIGMCVSAVWMALTGAPLAAKIGAPLAMAAVAVWLWRRPEA